MCIPTWSVSGDRGGAKGVPNGIGWMNEWPICGRDQRMTCLPESITRVGSQIEICKIRANGNLQSSLSTSLKDSPINPPQALCSRGVLEFLGLCSVVDLAGLH